MTGRPTIHDVAREAGVSIATVSRVLEGKPNVRRVTAERVRAAADKLGYAPNALARALRASTSGTVGMVVPQIANPFYAALVEAVVRAEQRRGREVILADSLDSPETEMRRVTELLARRVDGLVIVPCHQNASRDAVTLASGSVPSVQLDRTVRAADVDAVVCDDAAGIRRLLDHCGDRVDASMHFISATATSSTAARRLAAFRRCAGDAVPGGNLHLGRFDADWGHEQGRLIIGARPAPRTIVCGADIVAVGVLRAVREAGLEVPADVWVTGFDDIAFAGLSNPPITTVRQPVDRMAEACISALDRRSTSRGAPVERTRIAPTLVLRESTAG